LRQTISRTTAPIFAKFLTYDRYLTYYESSPLFPIAQGMLPQQPILGAKSNWPAHLFYRAGTPKRIGISQLRCQKFNGDDLATWCKNLVNIDPVTPEFQRLKGQSAGLLSLGGATARHRTISTQFRFTYSLGGVTGMLRGLHSGLCHAFLCSYFLFSGSVRQTKLVPVSF